MPPAVSARISAVQHDGQRLPGPVRPVIRPCGHGYGDMRFLIRDRGSNLTCSFDTVFEAAACILALACNGNRVEDFGVQGI